MKIYKAAGWLVTAGLAACVGVSSYVVANEVKAPAAAHAVGFPPTGTAQANFAIQAYGVRTLKDPKAVVSAEEAGLARRAYRAEPLSTTALSLIILATRDGEARNALLDLSGKLSRRNGLINDEQIRLAAAQGNEPAFFRWLSRSVLTNSKLRVGYVRAMADATARDGAVAALTPVIGANPAWSDFYWSQVVRRPASLENAGKLRVAIAGPPWRRTEITETDQALVLALVAHSQFDAAYDLTNQLRAVGKPQGRNLLANGDFARQPQLAPFDWLLAVSGALGSSVDEKDKSLLVSAIGGARGAAARQLIRLSPGDYNFGWSLSASTPINPSALTARVFCAEPRVKSVPPMPIRLSTGEKAAPLTIADGACRWHWLTIDLALPDDSPGVDAYFRNISLTPASGEDAKGAATPVTQGATGVDTD